MIKKILLAIMIIAIAGALYAQDFKWIDGTELGVSGRRHIYDGYNRLTSQNLEKVKECESQWVYLHAQQTSGLHIDFTTNATEIKVRYDLNGTGTMPHMPGTGSHGCDIYVKVDGKWRFLYSPYPNLNDGHTEATMFSVQSYPLLKDPEYKTFSINLPLYAGVKNFQIGIPEGSEITPITYLDKRPVVVYGTSITQGGCASRPGMSYTNILRRNIDRDVYNLGFSGSALFEHLMSDIIISMNPSCVIIDPIANMALIPQFDERYTYFYTNFRAKYPTTPIIFMEQVDFTNYWAIYPGKSPQNEQVDKLVEEWMKKDKNVYLIKASELYGDDYEASVDSIHATDLGFMRMSKPVIRTVKEALKLK